MTTQSADTSRAEPIPLVPQFEGQHMYSVRGTAASIARGDGHRSQKPVLLPRSPLPRHPPDFRLPSGSTVVRHYPGNKLYCLAVAMRVISAACVYMTETLFALQQLCQNCI